MGSRTFDVRHAPKLFEAYLDAARGRFETGQDLFADEAIMEYPFGSAAGIVSPVVGAAAIAAGLRAFLGSLDRFEVNLLNAAPLLEEDAIFAEFSATGKVLKSGLIYEQSYVMYMRAAGSKIGLIREYFDPIRVLEAFPPGIPEVEVVLFNSNQTD